MKNTRLVIAVLLAIVLSSFDTGHKTTIFMIGDSTMANKDTSNDKQERGWGMVLQSYFTDRKSVV